MKKYKYLGLVIELTRKCNLHCVHCMRGDAQNVTITREIIDKIIENVDDCMRFQLTGGEPLLSLDELEYLIDRIVESNYSANMIDFVTSGTVQDRRVIDILSRFCRSGKGRKAKIYISNDRFHDAKRSEEAYCFYEEATKDIPGIEIGYNGMIGDQKEDGISCFILSGRGKTVPAGLPPEVIRKESVLDHRICIGDSGKAKGWVMCSLWISAKGDVGFFEDRSFDTFDLMSFGNILKKPLYNMVQQFNADCLLTCKEVQILEMWQNYRQLKDNRLRHGVTESQYYLSELVAKVGAAFIKRVIKAREIAHKRWPVIPAQDIIEAMPIPDIALTFNDTIQEIADNSDLLSPGDIDRYIRGETRESATKAIDAISRDSSMRFYKGNFVEAIESVLRILVALEKPGAKIAANKFYGNGDIDATPEFKKLAELNEEYAHGIRIYDNNKMLCEQIITDARTSIMEQATKKIKNIGSLSKALAGLLIAGMLFGGKK